MKAQIYQCPECSIRRMQNSSGEAPKCEFCKDQEMFPLIELSEEEIFRKVLQLENDVTSMSIGLSNARAEKDQLKKELARLNMWRLGMFSPLELESDEAIAAVAKTEFNKFVIDYMQSDPTAIHRWYRAFVACAGECQKIISKFEIKKAVGRRDITKVQSAQKIREDEKAEKEAAREKHSPREKAIQAFLKMPGMSRALAEQMVDATKGK